jgi:hypothetical protein
LQALAWIGAGMLRRLAHLLFGPRPVAALAGLLSLALYVRTLAPSAMWYDMAEFPTAAYLLGIGHNTGYPLYLLLGKLLTYLPIGDVAYRVNLLSALAAALCVSMVVMIVWRITRSRCAALLAGLTLGATSTLWANATLSETYTLNAFLTALVTLLMLRWASSRSRAWLLAAFLCLGLGMGNHHLIQYFGAGMLVYWGAVHWRARRALAWRELPLMTSAFLAGFAINLYLPIRAAHQPALMWADPSDWRVFLRMITVGQARIAMEGMFGVDPASVWRRLGQVGLAPWREFTPVGLALALMGVWRLVKRDASLSAHMLVGSGLTAAMVLTYRIHDILDYFLPVYVMLAVWIGIGVAAVQEWATAWLGQRIRRGSARAVVALACLLTLGLPAGLVAREMDVLDRSQDDSSFLYANYLSGHIPPGGRVLADYWAWTPLVYYQTFGGWRGDLLTYATLSSAGIDWPSFLAERRSETDAVYVVAGGPLPPGLTASALLHPVGLGIVETVTDFDIPRLEHKDLWLPFGAVYRIVDRLPRLNVESVPASRRIDEIRFGNNLTLMGFGGPVKPQQLGSSPKLSYYWMLDRPTQVDYYIKVRLFDQGGAECQLRGLPTWDHSHLIGGLSPTSTWTPGVLMGERYDTLISWRLRPGRYTLRAWVFEGEEQRRTVSVLGHSAGDGVILGYLEVLPRDGPFDVVVQIAPRE